MKFTYVINQISPRGPADGISFVIQNFSVSAVGYALTVGKQNFFYFPN